MAKSFKIQLNPTFQSAVEIPRVGGDPMRVTFTFKAFDRLAMARIFDKWKEQGEEMLKQMREDTENDNPWSMEKLTTKEIELQASQLKDVVDGWGFSDEFNDENIEALVGTAVSVTDAIMEQYHEAYARARKGN
ncbi:hypothetical protein PMW_136 [Pseudomonas phage phiPMW]|uniref:Tail assembly chaperone n=1 Tax=Pseudomonas phage phiPMW TaxID=1815582 RepID=A0A1S5R1H9_9CAUD|nr:tail length tape measure protein [Pseudomonas phage phiPMW]ANA49261.1 hypothetical protein PMW_136 [Pseudomonas phage phiPMW]